MTEARQCRSNAAIEAVRIAAMQQAGTQVAGMSSARLALWACRAVEHI
jgi:hypothetical protein